MAEDRTDSRFADNGVDSPQPPALEVRRLGRKWGDFALRDVTLRLERGQYCVILGPSGSGKTLLLETIAGLHLPDTGAVFLDGQDVTRWPPERRKVGFVYQHYYLFPHLSVVDNIAYGLRYQRLSQEERQRRVAEVVDILGIRHLMLRSTVRDLSGGERQKVALARALVIAPRLLLLDEPLANLDFPSREGVLELLRAVRRRFGLSVLHVTHDYSEALAVADTIAVLDGGRVLQVGSPQEVFWRPASKAIAEFLGVANVLPAEIERREGRIYARMAGQHLLAVDGAYGDAGRAYVCIRPEDLSPELEGADKDNVLRGRLVELAERGFAVRAVIDLGGVMLQCTVPHSALERAGWRLGEQVAVSVRPDRVHVVRG
ncbi:MAG: ATP-binding cassette domain-containing protein [Armatimonadetes bacterium]|nr:ATP-binding cassette domain-containing protein [Armatimonadota bacterium]